MKMNPGRPLQISVRNAKDQFSNLLDLAHQGHEVVITSDGRPKAKLIPFQAEKKVFHVPWKLLKASPVKEGIRTEVLVREDRDARK